ncbi:MAG: hypothetical protein H0X51_00055 [Parachlamydiaceae bacterium]|nr:hypothetical protein [Parachlamydiaceae bacterium]
MEPAMAAQAPGQNEPAVTIGAQVMIHMHRVFNETWRYASESHRNYNNMNAEMLRSTIGKVTLVMAICWIVFNATVALVAAGFTAIHLTHQSNRGLFIQFDENSQIVVSPARMRKFLLHLNAPQQGQQQEQGERKAHSASITRGVAAGVKPGVVS